MACAVARTSASGASRASRSLISPDVRAGEHVGLREDEAVDRVVRRRAPVDEALDDVFVGAKGQHGGHGPDREPLIGAQPGPRGQLVQVLGRVGAEPAARRREAGRLGRKSSHASPFGRSPPVARVARARESRQSGGRITALEPACPLDAESRAVMPVRCPTTRSQLQNSQQLCRVPGGQAVSRSLRRDRRLLRWAAGGGRGCPYLAYVLAPSMVPAAPCSASPLRASHATGISAVPAAWSRAGRGPGGPRSQAAAVPAVPAMHGRSGGEKLTACGTASCGHGRLRPCDRRHPEPRRAAPGPGGRPAA